MQTTLSPIDLALGDFRSELKKTRRMLERIPDEHLAWQPHAKSMTLGALGAHLAHILHWAVFIITADEHDMARPQPRREPPQRIADLLATYDAELARLNEALEGLTEASLGETWTLRRGEHVFISQPRASVLRYLGISHLIHHRAQLGVYLRMLDVPLPPTFGPTADERQPG